MNKKVNDEYQFVGKITIEDMAPYIGKSILVKKNQDTFTEYEAAKFRIWLMKEAGIKRVMFVNFDAILGLKIIKKSMIAKLRFYLDRVEKDLGKKPD